MLHDIQALIIADSAQTRLFCHLTKKIQEFLYVQLTDVYGICVVELEILLARGDTTYYRVLVHNAY